MKANPAKDLLDALMAERTGDVVPKGYYTVKQLAQKTGTPERTLLMRLEQMKVERKMFRVKSGQVTRPIPHYKLL